MCDVFFHGIPGAEIRPFRLTQSKLFRREHQANFCKGQLVFSYICETAVSLELVADEHALFALTVQAWDVVFSDSYTHVIAELEALSGKKMLNPGVKSYTTVCDWMLRYFFGEN